MNQAPFFIKTLSKSKLVKPFTVAYFVFALVEVIAELNKDTLLIYLSKSLLMPLLLLIYFCSSKTQNIIFIIALIFAWFANLFFIPDNDNSHFIGTIFFLIYRMIVIFMVFKILKFPGYFPILIGSLPFLFVYLFVINLMYQELNDGFYIFILQGICLIVFGGYALGNYIFKSNKSNTFLLISTILFTATQFILILKIHYVNNSIFQPIAMVLFVFGQYLLYKFIHLEEKKKIRYEIINSHKKEL